MTKAKPIPSCVHTAYEAQRKQGLPYALIILLDSTLYVEATAKTAKAFETRLKAWTFETLPTLYRSDVRVFLCTKAVYKEVTLSRRSILP